MGFFFLSQIGNVHVGVHLLIRTSDSNEDVVEPPPEMILNVSDRDALI